MSNDVHTPKTHLQPAQYASWLKKAHDPDWWNHRYREGDANGRAAANAVLDLEAARLAHDTLTELVREMKTALERFLMEFTPAPPRGCVFTQATAALTKAKEAGIE